MIEATEEKIRIPRIKCTVCAHKFPDVNVPQPQLDSELMAHMVSHYREYIRKLQEVIRQSQRDHKDPMVDYAMQELNSKFAGMLR